MSADAHSAVDGKLPDAIVLRASDENEPTVKEGERRPFRVVNESAVHLSSTTQQVTMCRPSSRAWACPWTWSW